MFQYFPAFIAILSPVLFTVAAITSWFQPGLRPAAVKRMSTASTVTGLVIAVICCFMVVNDSLLETGLIGFQGLGISFRLDALSVVMLTMTALLSYIIVRFSLNYLDGDQRQGIFLGRLAATIASVQLLVLSGNLLILWIAWILTSISLHRLLIFYENRPGAQIAARKKFILARLGDVCLLAAVILLYNQFGTGDLETIFAAIRDHQSAGSSWAGLEPVAVLLVLVALLKSAQFPTHGWLIEVMETPTPVSALLHAGLLNAGPFLIIRMAYIVDASVYAPYILVGVCGFTALFGSVVYLTQTSVKTALAYSSIAHMGFSLFICGLGVYPAAMLHLVAHSFYKAHSFLSSGSVIDVLRGSKIASPAKTVSPAKVIIGMLLALVVYTAFAFVWGVDPQKELALLVVGAVIVLGLSRIFTLAIDSKAGVKLFLRAGLLAMIVTIAFLSLEAGSHHILSSQLPELSMPGFGELALAGIILMLFVATVLIQTLAPVLSYNSRYSALIIHIKNGLYVNAIFDRMVSALRIHAPENKEVVQLQVDQLKKIEYAKMERLKEQPVFANEV